MTPKDIPDLELWLRADTLKVAHGAGVSTWPDESGRARHATATGTARPTFLRDVRRGMPCVRFDDADDTMTTGLTLSAAPFTIAVVYAGTGPANYHRAVAGSNNWLIGPYLGHHNCYAGDLVAATDSTTAVVPGRLARVALTNDGSASHFEVDGVDRTATTSAVGVPGTVYLGAGPFGEPLCGDMAEVVAYSRVLAAGERAALDSYLARKWVAIARRRPRSRAAILAAATSAATGGPWPWFADNALSGGLNPMGL